MIILDAFTHTLSARWLPTTSDVFQRVSLLLHHYSQLVDRSVLFPANADNKHVVAHRFSPSLLVRYVRVRPTKWHSAIALRVELYGPHRYVFTGPSGAKSPHAQGELVGKLTRTLSNIS